MAQNQCDGCISPFMYLDSSIHRDLDDHAVMTCQAARYSPRRLSETKKRVSSWAAYRWFTLASPFRAFRP